FLSVSPCLRGVNPKSEIRIRERSLGGNGAGHRVARAVEGDQEGIAGFLELVAAVPAELLARKAVMERQRPLEGVSLALPKRRRSLDVGHQERDRAGALWARERRSGRRRRALRAAARPRLNASARVATGCLELELLRQNARGGCGKPARLL